MKVMLQTGTSVSIIAEELHFADPFHFSRTFKNLMGIAPSHFTRLRLSGTGRTRGVRLQGRLGIGTERDRRIIKIAHAWLFAVAMCTRNGWNNAPNFFLTQKRQLNTDLNLDGLVANSEQTHHFDTGPFKRTRQTFHFPERLAQLTVTLT